MNKENTLITCMDIPVESEIYPFTNMIIDFDRSPEYFDAVLVGNQIVANDAFKHSATKGFRDNYLIPSSVTSMLDSPIWNHWKIMGIFALAQREKKGSGLLKIRILPCR